MCLAHQYKLPLTIVSLLVGTVVAEEVVPPAWDNEYNLAPGADRLFWPQRLRVGRGNLTDLGPWRNILRINNQSAYVNLTLTRDGANVAVFDFGQEVEGFTVVTVSEFLI